MNTLWSYTRCSSLDQARNGYSLSVQNASVIRYSAELLGRAEFSNFVSGTFFVERAVSAFKLDLTKRPEGAKLHAALRKGDHVIFPKSDRGFRTMKDFIFTWDSWDNLGVVIHYVDMQMDFSTAAGRFFLQMRIGQAEFESHQISERTKEALAWMRENKMPTGAYPTIGYKFVGKAKPGRKNAGKKVAKCPKQQEIIRMIIRLRFTEKMSFERISNTVERWLARKEGRREILQCNQPPWPPKKCYRVVQLYLKEMNEKDG